MTDFVERLRAKQLQRTNRRLYEAYAEIERLREQLRTVLLHVADLRAEDEPQSPFGDTSR